MHPQDSTKFQHGRVALCLFCQAATPLLQLLWRTLGPVVSQDRMLKANERGEDQHVSASYVLIRGRILTIIHTRRWDLMLLSH